MTDTYIDPHWPWTGDAEHQARSRSGNEYHLIKHLQRDGHVSRTGYYLSSREAEMDRYWMGATLQQARERFHLEFVEGWKQLYLFTSNGIPLFYREDDVHGYPDLADDLRKRVAQGRRRLTA
jgi:hypothetical protein